MGQAASRVYGSLIKRPAQRYNIEHRASKVISKIEDPNSPAMRAPMFQTDKDILENVRRSNPELGSEMKRKDEALHSNLKDVYVTSQDPSGVPPDQMAWKEADPNRPLPLDRRAGKAEAFVPGLLRVDKRGSSRGKVTIEEAMVLLTDHATKPDIHTVEALSNKYRLNPETLEEVVKHFKLFKVSVPVDKEEQQKFDALQAGKDWVIDTKEEIQESYEYMQEKQDFMKRIKQKDAERKKLQKLESGSQK